MKKREIQAVKAQERIGFRGNLAPVYREIGALYNLGEIQSGRVILTGYEDFNVVLESTDGRKYFAKFFSHLRTASECTVIVETTNELIKKGVRHPYFLKNAQGFYITTLSLAEADLIFTLMDFLPGVTLYESAQSFSEKDLLFLAQQTAIIAQSEVQGLAKMNEWSAFHLSERYAESSSLLLSSDRALVEESLEMLRLESFNELPRSSIHGDLYSTNIMRDSTDELALLDFCRIAQYPRIQEIAVLFCEELVRTKSWIIFSEKMQFFLNEYEKYITLLEQEKITLTAYLKATYIMLILGASAYSSQGGSHNEENLYWLETGRKGLHLLSKQEGLYASR